MKTEKQYIPIVALALVVTVFALIALMYNRPPEAKAAAYMGSFARVSSSSLASVGPTQNKVLFGTTTLSSGGAPIDTQCSARIITTVASAIMLSFGQMSSTTPSGTIGHLQAASTTVAYDSGLYGCGLVTAYAFSSTTITLTETL